MDYMGMMKRRNPEKTALIEDGVSYSYGKLVKLAMEMSTDETVFSERKESIQSGNQKIVHLIRRKRILEQLLEFLACNERGEIPVIVPCDAKVLPEIRQVPEQVCMAVMTSGTTGIPKLLYRTYESWAEYFPIQNEIFGIDEKSRLFVQGSLAFTGNLNLYMAQFFAGATIVAQNRFQPKEWIQVIEREQVNGIYLIPSKLMCLPVVMKKENTVVRTILSGSQSLGREDARKLKQIFPETKIILYYGASELNYITYVTDENMTAEKNLIGRPFPKVDVFVKDEEIFVNTDYHVEGVTCPYSLSDKGYTDTEGNFYFAGRSDDIINIRGRKVSSFRIENSLIELSPIREAAVMMTGEKEKELLTAFVRLEDDTMVQLAEYDGLGQFVGEVREEKIYHALRKKLAHYEMPCRIIVLKDMPKRESGKMDKKRIVQEWNEFWERRE